MSTPTTPGWYADPEDDTQLRYFDGLTQSEIAQQIGISQMHVSRLLVRSLETLGTHSAAAAES